MRRVYLFPFVLLSALLVVSCSSLPGLRVLTGEGSPEANADQTVQALDLVMADKFGRTDPAISAAADRIEAAAGNVDIIEIRKDDEARTFQVNLLFAPPRVDMQTLDGQIALLDSLRRTAELTWQGTMQASEGADILRILILGAQQISTLDNGASYIGIVQAQMEIDRAEAASYLAGARSLTQFNDLIVMGTLNYASPSEMTLYEGQPNHPMFMLPAAPQ